MAEEENTVLNDVEYMCPICVKRFPKDRKYNYERHLETCKKKRNPQAVFMHSVLHCEMQDQKTFTVPHETQLHQQN